LETPQILSAKPEEVVPESIISKDNNESESQMLKPGDF
jgi:hypothetical protein